jgi:hypothetical protein
MVYQQHLIQVFDSVLPPARSVQHLPVFVMYNQVNH